MPRTRSAAANDSSSTIAESALAARIDYETLLSKLTGKDRQNVERHVTALETLGDAAHVALWKRLACDLMTLAPLAAKTLGQQSVQFFIADGKYRMQVFALHDERDGKIAIYAPNELALAIKQGIVTAPKPFDTEHPAYDVAGTRERVSIEELDGKSANPAPFYKDMLGWNRRALRMTLVATASDQQVEAVEALCVFGARRWAPAAAAE